MNAIYKVIWNDAIRQYQVVNELCRSRRKACSVKAVHTDGTAHHGFGARFGKCLMVAGSALLLLSSFGNAWAVTKDGNTVNFEESLVLTDTGGLLNNGNSLSLSDELLSDVNSFNFQTFQINGTVDATFWDDSDRSVILNSVTFENKPTGSFDITIQGEKQFRYDDQNGAYTYYFNVGSGGIGTPDSIYFGLQLSRIDVKTNQLYSFNASGGSPAGEKDLDAQITGAGSVEYIYDAGENSASTDEIRYGGTGYITVTNGTNAYSGETFIGKYINGTTIDDHVYVYAGGNYIFGNGETGAYTSNLNIKTGSGLEMRNTTQWTHALAGGGYIHLEDVDSLLHVKDDNRDAADGVMDVNNLLSGAGTVWVNFNGGEIRFNEEFESPDAFTGWVVLQDTAGIVQGPNTAVFHNNAAHLLLAENGVLKINGTNPDEEPEITKIGNLSVGYTYDGNFNKTKMSGSGVADPDRPRLEFQVNPSDTVHDYLVVNNLSVGNAEIAVDFGSGFESILQGKNGSLLTADEGENKTLIRVTGTGAEEAADFIVDMADTDPILIKREDGTDVAETVWSFDEHLTKVKDDEEGVDWALGYSLSQVNLLDSSGEGLVLRVADDATSPADRDFTATITGSGNLTIRGNPDVDNDVIALGKPGNTGPPNSYTGKTFVKDGATVVFQADTAMGNTSSLELEAGTTVDFAGFDQTVLNLSGTGSLVVDDGAKFTLDKSKESGTITVDASLGKGADETDDGVFIVRSSGGSLVFGSSEAYDGIVRLENTSTTLTDNTADVLSESILQLYSGAALHIGASGGKLAGLTSDASNGDIFFDGFNLGASGGTKLELDSGSSSGNFNISLPGSDDGFAIADGNLLIESDNPGNSQILISGNVSETDFTLSGADGSGNLVREDVAFSQGGKHVANTDWTLSLDNNGASGLGLQYELTGIELLASGSNYLVIDTDASATEGSDDLELNAQVTGSGNIAFNAADNQTIVFTSKEGESNNYTGATLVQNGTLSLGSDNVLGGNTSGTSVLDVNAGAGVLLNGTTQLVHGLEGSGSIDLGTGTLNLTKTEQGDQSIANALSGNSGTLAVNLAGGSLSFANTSSDSWAGRLALTNTLLVLTGNTERALDDVSVAANSDAKIVVDSHNDTLGSLALSGGQIEFGNITLGDEQNSASLVIMGELSGSGSVSFSGNMTVSDSLNLLDADDGDLSQVVISAGSVAVGTTLTTSIADLTDVSVQDGAAITKWTLSDTLEKKDNDFVIEYQLYEIKLQKVLRLEQATSGDNVLLARVTGTGSISFDGGDIIVTNDSNDYSGATYVTSGSLTLGADRALGETSGLYLADGTTFSVNGHTQTVGGLMGTGKVDFGTLGGLLTVSGTPLQDDTAIGNLITGSSGMLAFENAGELSFTNSGNDAGDFTGTISLSGTSVNLADSTSTTSAVFSDTNVILGSGGAASFGNGVGSGSMTLKGLELSADADIEFDGIDLTTSGGAALVVGTLTGTSGFGVDIDLTADISAGNVLVADDRYNRLLIDAGIVDQNLSGYSGILSETTSAIKNDSGNTVAHGVWSGCWNIDESGLSVKAGLSEVQLADASGSGLVLDATGAAGSDAELKARITDWVGEDGKQVAGVLTVAGTGAVTISNTANAYQGKTNVLAGSTLIVTGTLGQTSLLNNAGSVQIGATGKSADVWVGGLSGAGALTLTGGSKFTVATAEDLTVENNLSFGSLDTFTVVGEGEDRIELTFAKENAGASGTFDFTNVEFDLTGNNKETVLDSAGLNLTDSRMTVARPGTGEQANSLGEVVLTDSTLSFTGIELATDGTAYTPLLHVDNLSVVDYDGDGAGLTLDINANLTDNSNLLTLDNAPFKQALMEYETAQDEENLETLITGSNAVSGGTTKYRQRGDLKAYVTWGAGKINVNTAENIISSEYSMTGIQLADTDDGGLTLQAAADASDADKTLSAIVSDYVNEEGEVIAGDLNLVGDLFIGTGAQDEAPNTYTGKTNVSGGTVTLRKHGSLGMSRQVTVENGAHLDFGASGSESIGSIAASGDDALTGKVDLTLGTRAPDRDYGDDYQTSSITGANDTLTGALTLADGHTLTLDHVDGVGGMTITGTSHVEEGGTEENAGLVLTNAQGTFDNKLSGKLDVDITSSGALTWTGTNDYTGATIIRGDGFTLVGDDVFGTSGSHTSKLTIESGATVGFGTTNQYAGEIEAHYDDALAGSGSLTLDKGGAIGGVNAGYSGTVVVLDGNLAIRNADSLGSGTANLSGAGAVLVIDGVSGTDGAYATVENVIKGAGSVRVESDSVVHLTGSNDFSGGLLVLGSLLAENDVASHIGSGTVSIDETGSAVLNGSGNWTLSNKLTGTGELSISANGGTFDFGYAETAADDFTGTLKLSSAILTLDGNETVNAKTVAGADLTLDSGAQLTVKTDYTGASDHADVLTAGSDSRIFFSDLTPWDSNYEGVTVGRVAAEHGATIAVDALAADQSGSGSMNESGVLHADNENLRQTLINASGGVNGEFSLEGADMNGHLTQTVTINDESGNIGTATYDFGLAQDSLSVHLTYRLTEIVIDPDKSLMLSGVADDDTAQEDDSILSAKVSGHGNLEIAGNAVRLTNGDNSYSGSTTVQTGATLYAEDDTLGETNLLDVLGTAYVDDNEVDVLNVGETGTLHLTGDLTIDGGEASVSSIDGKVLGSGKMTLLGGRLNVSSANSDYSGTIENSGIIAFTDDDAGLGIGAIKFLQGAELDVTVSGSKTLTNTVTSSDGYGVIDVSGTGASSVFAFSSAQASGAFDGTLNLAGVGYDFNTNGNDTLKNAALVLGTGALVKIAQDADSNQLDGLTLSGGVIDFGSAVGHIQLSGGDLTVAEESAFRLDNNGMAVIKNDDGSAAFGSGSSSLVLVSDVGNHGSLSDAELDRITVSLDDGSSGYRRLITQRGQDVAALEGTLGDLFFAGDDLTVGLKNAELELLAHDGSGYVISESGTISYQVTGIGDLTVNNEVELSHSNTYTGDTYVTTSGWLTVSADTALGGSGGNYGALTVSEGGQVIFGGTGQTTQTIDNLNVEGESALSGDVILNVAFAGGAAGSVDGANTDFSGSINLTGNGTLALGDEDALGDAAINVGADATLQLSGFGTDATNEFDNMLSGSGTIALVGSDVTITGANTGLVASWNVADGSILRVEADASHTVANHLGTGAVALEGEAIFNSASGWTLGNALTGNGTLTVTAGDKVFAFNQANSGFTGKLILDHATFALGVDTANETTLTNAALQLESGATVTVGTGERAVSLVGTNTDSALVLNGGTLVFDGTAGLGVGTDVFGQLVVDSLDISSGGTISIASDAAQSVGSQDVDGILAADQASIGQWLITVGGTITGDENDLTLSVNGSSTVTAAINDGVNQVAVGTYDYVLDVDNDNVGTDGLGLAFALTQVDIIGKKTLQLNGEGDDDKTLEAVVTGDATTEIEVTGGDVVLTKNNNATAEHSGFSGTVHVASGSLTVHEGSLGAAKLVDVDASMSLVNEGANRIGGLDVAGTVTLNDSLSIMGSADSTVTGSFTGGGSLTLESGTMTVQGDSANYEGAISLGTASTGATIKLGASGSLGTGIMTFANENSVLDVTVDGSKVLSNLLSGTGIVTVSGDGTGDTFAFASGQTTNFSVELDLTGVGYDFGVSGNDVLDNVALSVTGGYLTVNGTTDVFDREIHGLTLENTLVDFGKIGAGTGVIDLGGESFAVNGTVGSTTIRVDSSFEAVDDELGSAAFGSGSSVALITNANSMSGLENLILDMNGSDAGDFTQTLRQNGGAVAQLEGSFSGFRSEMAEDDNLYDLSLGLTNETLRIYDGKTYTVSEDGTIGLVIADSDNSLGGGSLLVSGNGVEVTLTNTDNSFRGSASVAGGATLLLGANDVIKTASVLNVAADSFVDFGSTNQTVNTINIGSTPTGALISEADAGNTLTVMSGGTVAGKNDAFHMDWAIQGGKLAILDVDALGHGDATLAAGATLEIKGSRASGTFVNALSGAGALAIIEGADVELDGQNLLTGGLTVDADSRVKASGNIYSHIGSGLIALAGDAEFTLTSGTGTLDWTWNRTVSGAGSLTLAREDENEQELRFTEESISDFSGGLTLDNWTIKLVEDEANGTLAALSGSDITSITFRSGANAVVNGVADLGSKNVVLAKDGILTIDGFGVPGADGSGSYLKAGSLGLSEGFVINLDTGNSRVDSSTLLTQDDAGSMQTTIVDTEQEITLASGTVTVNNNESVDGTIRFDISQTGTDDESGTVAQGIYGYGFATSADKTDLVLDYKLKGIDITEGKTLVLSGDENNTSGNASTLSVYLTGDGNLRIAENTVHLKSGESDYSGTTTVSSGATLYAEAGTLGDTARLTTASGAHTYIEGNNEVRGFTLASGGVLAIGPTDTTGTGSDVTLTILSSTDDTTPDEQINHLCGELHGQGDLKVVGNGQVDEGVDADLTIHGSQTSFFGDLVLESGAWVDIEANDYGLFGNSTAKNEVVVSEDSLLTIESTQTGDALFYGVFRNGKKTDGTQAGGTVEITLAGATDQFHFAADQADAGFNGAFVLNRGTIDFTNLFTSTGAKGDPLQSATLVLEDNGIVNLVGDGTGTSSLNERKLGGLTMAGGTIEAGAIGYEEGKGAFNSTINLGGSGSLTLEHATGAADDRQSTVVLGTTDDAIQISDSGSEILNAGSVGAKVTVISGIGDFVLVNGDKSETVSGSTVIGSDYLHAERPANGTAQEIEQKVSGSSSSVSVAETVRTYDENFTYNSESGTLSIGYKVSDLGLLYETGNVSSSNYADDSRWQGLTITANAAADGTSVFDALIKNGENGNAAGNIVFKGADGKGTITLAGDENTYTGKTRLTENAQVVFDTDSGFGNTDALRVDAGSSVDFAGHDQSMGALFALGDDALKSTVEANLAVDGTAIINGANNNLYADWTFSGSVTIRDELSLGHGAVELAGSTTTLTISGSEAKGTIDNAITGGELTNIYVTSGANVSFANDDILSGPNFTGNIAVWSGASAGFAIESGATVSNGLTIGSTGKVSFESTSGGTLAFEDANIYGTLELNNVTFDLDAHGDAFKRGSSLVANAGTRIDVSDAVSGAVSNITLTSGSTVAFDNGTPGAAGEGEVASINLGSSGTLTLAGDVTVDLDINDYADASDVEDAQGDLINRPLTAQDLTGQDGGAVLATLIAGQVSSVTADLNLKTDGNDVEENKLNIAIRNAANGEEVATGTYDYKLVLDKDGSGSGLKLSYGLTEVTIHDGKTLELTGTSADEDDNELTAAVRGTGNLRITEGEVTLVDKDSDYTGSTSVAAGAALVAGSAGHTLGETSELRLEGATGVVSGASATILGEETVYGLNVQSGATLNLVAGSGEGAGAVLTVAGGEDGNVIAGNDALGQGGGKLAVSGDGTKLTVEGANSRFTGITSVESGAVLSAGNTASLGTGNTEIAAGGTLEVVAAVDATSGASRVVSQITNSVTGAGDVVINLSGTAQAAEKRFSFADDQTSGFSGNIVLENGGYTLAYANDGDAEDDYTANQLAAMNSRISVEENGHLYVSTVDHQINRYIDKHVRALTLNGGNIYFGGLRYDMTSMDESLGGQLQLAGDTDKSATLEIQPESLVNLDAGATNTLTDGSELLIADEGAKIDLIQNAADVVLGSDADTIWASSSDEADFTDLLNDYLKLNTVNSDAEQTLTQDGRDVAIVTRGFGSSGHNEVFGVEQNDSSTWDLYLNYHVSKIELIDSENAQGLLITNDEAGSDSDLTALVTGSGNLTLSGVSGTTIALGDGSDATQNDYTGRTTVTGSVTVKAAEDNAFGNTYRLNVESGAKVDFGEFDQTLGILEARGDDALAGTADSVVTITDDMIVTGKNDGFQSQLRLEFSGTGTVTDVGGLGTGDISIGEDYTLVIADENASDGNRVGNNITGSGTVVIGRDDATGTIELGGSNAGFTGNVRVESDWALEASMDKGETAADRIGSGNLVLSSGATGSFTQTEGSLDWTSAVIGEGYLVLSAGKDSDVTISGGLDYFNGDITIGGGRFELASGNGNVENVDGSNLHATGEDTTVVVADQGTVILGDNLSVESGASIVFEGDVTPGTIGDAQLVVAGDLTITESNVTINVGGELDPGDPDTASLNVQDVTSADRSDELALVIAEADNIVLSGNDLVVLGPDGNPINNPEDRLGVSIVDGDEEIATGYYDFGLTSSESGGRDILGVGYQLMEVNVKDGKTLVLNGAHAADVDYENASSFDADIIGNGNFALANGELTLTGKNTYTGSTLVGDGTSETTLTVDRGSSLGDTSTVNVSDNATLVNRSDLTDAGSIQVASGGTVTLEDGSVFKVTDAANESNIAGTLTGSGALHLNDNVDIDVAADKAQNFTGIVSVGSGAVYNLLSNVTDTVTVASRFESDSGDDAVVGMTGDFSLEAKNTAYHGAFVLSDGTVIRTNSIASLGAADATITTAGDYAEAGGTASQADDNATVILDYADRETVGDVTQTMTSGITFVKTGDGVVELSAESLGAGAVKSSEGGIIFGAAGDSTVFGTALTVEGGAWAAGFGGVGSLSVASDGAFYLGGVDGYNSIVSSGWTSSEGSSTVQFTVSGNVTNNGTIYVGNKNSSGDTPADSNYIGNELVIEGDYITDGGTLDLNAIIAGKDNSKSDHVTIKGEIDGTGFIDVNYDSSVSTGGELEYLGLVSVAEGESGDSLKLKDSIKIGDLYYRLMWSSEQNEYYLQSSVTDPGDDPWNTEDVENIHAGTRSALAFMQAQAFDLSLRGHLGETLYVDPVTGEQRKSSFWMVQRGDWTKFSNASGQMNADGNLYTTHLGTDLFKRETDGATFRWGVLAGFADGDFDVSSNVDGKSSKGSFRGYSAGLYMTAESKAESGPFLGLQLRWNRFDNEVGPDDYDVNGLSLTAEASWDQLLSKGLTDGGRHYEWRLEPHVRAYWTNFSDPGNWTSSLGETYSSDFDNGLLVRVGARTKIQTTLGTGPAWQAYAEANWVYNNGDYSTTMSTQYGDVTSTQNGAEFAEFRLGLEAQFTTNVNVWLEGHHQTGSDDYESTGAMFGFKYMW
jgi:hypothetical protein